MCRGRHQVSRLGYYVRGRPYLQKAKDTLLRATGRHKPGGVLGATHLTLARLYLLCPRATPCSQTCPALWPAQLVPALPHLPTTAPFPNLAEQPDVPQPALPVSLCPHQRSDLSGQAGLSAPHAWEDRSRVRGERARLPWLLPPAEPYAPSPAAWLRSTNLQQ